MSRLKSASRERKRDQANYGILTLAATGVALAYRAGARRREERQEALNHMPTEAQVRRGTIALVPFVQEWKLPLNPESLDFMAFVVLQHAGAPGNIDTVTEQEHDNIDDSVRSMIMQDARAQRRMSETQERSAA